MTNNLENSENELNQVTSLLDKNVPSYRQAYSDKTAWIMAYLAEFAYIRFNPLFSNAEHKEYFLKSISKLVNGKRIKVLHKLIDLVGYDHNEEKEKLIKELGTIRMKLLDTFDSNGTQAILVSNDSFIVLAFRGTEAMSVKDIKADAKAKTTHWETGGKIHSGFKEAFEHVAIKIQKKLNEDELQEMPLFVTGHSLGGALANIAAKKLTHRGGIAACYTFGAPRVGNEEWIDNIKTPIYRLVNAADCVTMLPPGTEIITIISWLSQFIPWVGKSISSWLMAKLGGYIHAGNMRYLTNCPRGDYDNVKLLYSVSLFYRIKGLLYKKLPFRKFLADHAIKVYRKKLAILAERGNTTT